MTAKKTKTAKRKNLKLQVRFHSAVLGREILCTIVEGRSPRQLTKSVEEAIKEMASHMASCTVFCPGDSITVEGIPDWYKG